MRERGSGTCETVEHTTTRATFQLTSPFDAIFPQTGCGVGRENRERSALYCRLRRCECWRWMMTTTTGSHARKKMRVMSSSRDLRLQHFGEWTRSTGPTCGSLSRRCTRTTRAVLPLLVFDVSFVHFSFASSFTGELPTAIQRKRKNPSSVQQAPRHSGWCYWLFIKYVSMNHRGKRDQIG